VSGAKRTKIARAKRTTHEEALPTRRVVAIEAVRASVVAALLGCAVLLILDTLFMLVADALVGVLAGGTADNLGRLGRGVVAATAAAIVALGLLAGFLATAGRFALAEFLARLDPKDRRLRDTMRVRGQVSPSPFGPAIVSVLVIGGLALLAAVPCIVLAAEYGARPDDELSRAEFGPWLAWSVALVAVVLLATAAVWWLAVRNRRWAAEAATRFPRGVVGDAGPAVRVTSRPQRRAARRGWTFRDWLGWCGTVFVLAGAGLVFLGVYLHQPGLYADPIRYAPDVERFIATGTTVGGVVLGLGLLILLATGLGSAGRVVAALRRATVDPAAVTDDDRREVRSATTSLAGTLTAAQAFWAALGALAAGWWFAATVETPADGASASAPELLAGFGGTLLLIVWLLCGIGLVVAQFALNAKGPALRNRFGYELPSEADDREFPDLPLFGQ